MNLFDISNIRVFLVLFLSREQPAARPQICHAPTPRPPSFDVPTSCQFALRVQVTSTAEHRASPRRILTSPSPVRVNCHVDRCTPGLCPSVPVQCIVYTSICLFVNVDLFVFVVDTSEHFVPKSIPFIGTELQFKNVHC